MKLDQYGRVIDDNGELVLVDGKPITITGAVSQEVFDTKVKERLKKAEDATLQKISDLESRLAGSLSASEAQKLQDQIEALEKTVTDKEALAEQRAKEATQKAQDALNAATDRANLYKRQLQENLLKMALRDAAHNPEAGVDFFSADDLVNQVRPFVSFEEAIDPATNQPIPGEVNFKIRMKVMDKELKREVEQDVTPAQAAAIIAERCPHYVRSRTAGGSGNGVRSQRPGSTQRPAKDDAPADMADTSIVDDIAAGINDTRNVGVTLSDPL